MILYYDSSTSLDNLDIPISELLIISDYGWCLSCSVFTYIIQGVNNSVAN